MVVSSTVQNRTFQSGITSKQDLNTFKTMRRTIYLAGPVEKVDDATTWRENVIKEYRNVEFINPMDHNFDSTEDRYEIFFTSLRAVQLSDFVIVNYVPGAETYGTPIEAFWAWLNGVPVLTWSLEDPEDMPSFLVTISDNISNIVRDLVQEGWTYDSH